VQHFSAANAVLAVLGFKITVMPKAGDGYLCRQGFAQVSAVTPKA
jgi:hypothetical protein